MNVWKKISALTFVLVLALALSVTAFASQNLTDGKVGSGGETPTALSKTVNLKKDIRVYNANNHVTGSGETEAADGKVLAPTFSYTYTVTAPTTTDLSVTDAAGVEAPVNQGIIPGLVVNGGTEAASGASSITGTLSFSDSQSLKANSSGAINTYDVSFNFNGVTFPRSGVYRYQIAETLTSGAAYSTLSMVDGDMNTVYLDVYVDGAGNIYGYVCLPANTDVVPADEENSTPETTKVNGFVYSATANQNGADSYYTYDLKLQKTVTGDSYAQANHAFPFTVIFTQDSNMTANFKIVETITQASVGDTATTGLTIAASTTGWSGVVYIKSGANIVYSGIPCGMDVEIYETNTVPGVTYKATTTANNGENDADTTTNDTVISTTATPTATAQGATKANAYESTKATFDTALATAVSVLKSYAVTDALVNISPTGVTMRYAPYLLTLCAGITVLPLTRSYKRREEE
jgi:hypothetical protein